METDTPKTDIELAVSKGQLTNHLVALCRRMERERNAFERQYERFREQCKACGGTGNVLSNIGIDKTDTTGKPANP